MPVGFRWNCDKNPERVRVERRFRYWVKRPSKLDAPIERLHCQFCGAGQEYSEFHHIDYQRTFYGVWACPTCHRKIDHGSLEIRPDQFLDYQPIVSSRLRTYRWREVTDKNTDFDISQMTG